MENGYSIVNRLICYGICIIINFLRDKNDVEYILLLFIN